jgi:hypothetical protein
MSDSVHIHWFRQDLRLSDNPSLSAAAANGAVLPVYILDDANAGDHRMGGASRWWLHHSLTALNQALDGKLIVLSGNPAEILGIWLMLLRRQGCLGTALTIHGGSLVMPPLRGNVPRAALWLKAIMGRFFGSLGTC